MEGLTCPHCQKVSYSASPRAFSPCPHCKFRFAVSAEAGRTVIVIDRQLSAFRENYARSVREASGEDVEVVVDRREAQRPFVGVDRRRVISRA